MNLANFLQLQIFRDLIDNYVMKHCKACTSRQLYMKERLQLANVSLHLHFLHIHIH